MKIKIDEINIKIKILEDKKTKAIISLDFGDFIIKGFRLQESKFKDDKGDKNWLTPPSYNGGGFWHPIFFMPDKSMWQMLQKRILDEYELKRKEYYAKKMDIEKEDWNLL